MTLKCITNYIQYGSDS